MNQHCWPRAPRDDDVAAFCCHPELEILRTCSSLYKPQHRYLHHSINQSYKLSSLENQLGISKPACLHQEGLGSSSPFLRAAPSDLEHSLRATLRYLYLLESRTRDHDFYGDEQSDYSHQTVRLSIRSSLLSSSLSTTPQWPPIQIERVASAPTTC